MIRYVLHVSKSSPTHYVVLYKVSECPLEIFNGYIGANLSPMSGFFTLVKNIKKRDKLRLNIKRKAKGH